MLTNLRSVLYSSMIDREEEIDAILVAAIAREHCLFVGPPGIGKSMVATGFTKAIGVNCFQILLTKYTNPDEVFGPLKISALKQDKLERNLDGYAADCSIFFIDEIWKASSAILNSILTILQERQYDNGGVRIDCPLRLAIAVSNEYPDEKSEELSAIFDRFMIRRNIKPISPSSRRRLMYDSLPPVNQIASQKDLDDLSDQADRIDISDDAKEACDKIIDELYSAGIRVSDRRMRKSTAIMRAAALIDGDSIVETKHLEYLKDVFWSHPDQIDKAGEIVTAVANPVGAKINTILREVDQIISEATDSTSRITAIKKVEDCEREAHKLTKDGNGRAQKALAFIQRERIKLNAAALGLSSEKVNAMLGDVK